MYVFDYTAPRLTRSLTRLARPAVRLAGRSWPAFVLFAGLGLGAAVLLVTALSLDRGLSMGLMAGLAVAAVATEGGLALLRRALGGKDQFVFYESFLAIAAVVALCLLMMGRPVLAPLEAVLLGVGLLQAVGRMGCFMAGCCHGRPAAWGVCYHRAHAAQGFDAYLVGVPLLPVQLAEMVWSLGSVALGSVLVFQGAMPGSGLAAYVTAYALGRFFFEFARGDAGRPYVAGFSEAQWTALFVTTAVVGAGWGGVLPASAWHLGVWIGLMTVAGLVLLKRRTTTRHRLLHPGHVGEVARALRVLHAGKALARSAEAPPHVVRTSLGVELSGGDGQEAAGPVQHYAVILPEGAVDTAAARALTGVVRSLLVPLASQTSSIESTREAGESVHLRLISEV